MALVSKGAAVLVKDVEAKEKLVAEVVQLMNDEPLRAELATKVLFFAKKEAATDIANEVLKLMS